MKHGRKPTVQQCKFIEEHNLNPKEWLVERDTFTEVVLVHRENGMTRTIYK